MIFTIVTIIFLPLSFCVGFFGMNAAELNDGRLSLATELRFMVPVSAAIAVVAFACAFSRSVLGNSAVALARSAVGFACGTALTWLLVRTGLYATGRVMLRQANRLRDREAEITGAMKAEVLRREKADTLRREKNLERLWAASHDRRRRLLQPLDSDSNSAAAIASGRTTPFSPYSAGMPGSPFIGQVKMRAAEVDVELGDRVTTMRQLT